SVDVTESGVIAVGAIGENSCGIGVNNYTFQYDTSCSSAGSAYLFRGSGSTWMQTGYLKAPSYNPMLFGSAVGIGGGFVSVTAPQENSCGTNVGNMTYLSNHGCLSAGAAYVYTLPP